MWAAFPPLQIAWAAWPGLALFILAVRGARGRDGFLVGWVFGLASFGPLLWWLSDFGVIAWAPLVAMQSLAPALVGAVGARLSHRSRWEQVVGIPVIWAAAEIVRARVPFGGFDWGAIGYTQVGQITGRLARIVGVHGVAAWMLVVAVLVAIGMDGWKRGRVGIAAIAMLSVPALAPIGAPAVLPRTLDIAAVQGNVPRDRFTTIGRVGERTGPEDLLVIDNHIEVTERLLADPQAPDVIVWPENAFDRDPRRLPARFDQVRDLVGRIGAPLIMGAILDAPNGFTNSNLLVSADGVEQRYDKMHLVPFGEYVPLAFARKIVPLLASEVPLDGVPGASPVIFDTPGARIGSVICFESSDGRLVARNVRDGAQVIVVTTNDASFGDGPAARQHLQISRMRAIENGRALAHVAIAGESALVLPDGDVIASAPLFTPALLRARIPVATGRTPFTRYGEAIELVLLLAGAATIVLARRVRKELGDQSLRDPADL